MPSNQPSTASPPQASSHVLMSRAPVTDRVNEEPSVINGMTVSEAQYIGLVSLVVFLIVGAVLFAATGLWQAILLLAVFGPSTTLWMSSTYLAKVKRGRPEGYYGQALHWWMADRAWVTCKYIDHYGHWELGRKLEFSVHWDLNPRKGVSA